MTVTALGHEVEAKRFQALSDPKRLRILAMLTGGERCVCELTDAMEAGQSLLSFHLKTLKDAGLVSDRREGRWVYYSLVPDVLDEMIGVLGGLAERVDSDGGCC